MKGYATVHEQERPTQVSVGAEARAGAPVQAGRGTAAIVVTYNRADVLRSSLLAIRRQHWAPDGVFVVDNGSSDQTGSIVRSEFPEVTYHRLEENLGFGGGLAAGMAEAWRQGYRYFWLLDDDSQPAPAALEQCMDVARSSPGLGIIGLTGGVMRWGTPEFIPEPEHPDGRLATSTSDWVHLDGAVVPREVVDRLGYPRSDYFMMLEDVEYSNRIKRAGFEVAHFQLHQGVIDRGNLGSGGDGKPSPPWRGYYQTRNQLFMALDHRSLAEVIGWLYRQVKLIAATVLLLDRKGSRVRLRMLGAWHALRGVRGRTVEPSP
jgi:rhamnopyranosyl-N-acetylglucosaminyl-diphospho-decaprenol beta-1,3/1,4-galactofuranosyltransferase